MVVWEYKVQDTRHYIVCNVHCDLTKPKYYKPFGIADCNQWQNHELELTFKVQPLGYMGT